MSKNSPNWTKAMSDCLAEAERAQAAGSACPVVDHELTASFTEGAEDICAWLICRTEKEKQLFRDTELARFVSDLRKRMLAAGFSESAIASLRAQVTSRAEIQAAGGRM